MNILKASQAALLAATTVGLATAQANDECTGAIAITAGSTTTIDTTLATLSAEVWNCALGGGPDIWYSYTATNGDLIVAETCGSTYDTALEIYSGTCAGLVLEQCNDDSCGFQSSVSVTGVAGTEYFIRVGGWNGSTGAGVLDLSLVAPPTPPPTGPNCLETVGYIGGNGGSPGGAIYFDVTTTTAVTIDAIWPHFSAAAGTPVGIEIYTTPGGFSGAETDPSLWTLAAMDNGTALSAGFGAGTEINLASPLALSSGTVGIALVAIGSAHAYTNGNGTNEVHSSPDGVLTLNAGSATNSPFAAPIFSPRVFNGVFCHGSTVVPLGTPFCMANNNSTGVPGTLSVTGSSMVSANDVTLSVGDIPAGQFGIFVVAASAGAMTPVNQGILCLSGPIGRYTASGQIWQADSNGEASLMIDLANVPTPSAFVATNPGDTWFFQAWHRDVPPSPGAPGSNFTTGREVTFN